MYLYIYMILYIYIANSENLGVTSESHRFRLTGSPVGKTLNPVLRPLLVRRLPQFGLKNQDKKITGCSWWILVGCWVLVLMMMMMTTQIVELQLLFTPISTRAALVTLVPRHMVRLFTSQNAQTLQSVLQFWKDATASYQDWIHGRSDPTDGATYKRTIFNWPDLTWGCPSYMAIDR
jgi:hypothetical protein